MPTLLNRDLDFILEKVNRKFSDYPIFVETGTFEGETTLRFENNFNLIYTIELSQFLYENFNKKTFDRGKIVSLLGDSSIVLDNIIKDLDRNTIFFLDGHWSSGITAKGIKDCPLYEEISIINEKFTNEALIIIDDLRMFGTKGNEDWSNISINGILEIAKGRISTYFSENDRLILLLKEKES